MDIIFSCLIVIHLLIKKEKRLVYVDLCVCASIRDYPHIIKRTYFHYATNTFHRIAILRISRAKKLTHEIQNIRSTFWCFESQFLLGRCWAANICPGGDTEFRCATGECIQKTRLCDGYDDCEHGDDEEFCGPPIDSTSNCTTDQFRCDSGECLSLILQCDDRYDCLDASDEFACGVFELL